MRKSSYKRARRARFQSRFDDQIRKDLQTELDEKNGGGAKGPQSNGLQRLAPGERVGPSGTTNKIVLDDDTPGSGRFYCIVCAR